MFAALALDFSPLSEPVAPVAAVAEAASEAKVPPAAAQPPAQAAPQAAPTAPAQAGESAPAPVAGQAEPAGPPTDWKALKRKEDELARKEQALKLMEKDLEDRLARLTKLEGQIKAMLEEAKGMKDEKFRHLVDVYANMKAQQAAQALENLDEDTAVKILAGMRGRQAGEILNYVSPKKAAVFSQALTQMQMPFK